MFGFVYIWFDRHHKRFYIGSHWGTEDDGYICSSTWMKAAYKKRPEDFKRKIISRIYSNRMDLLKEEQRWLDMIKDHELKGVRYFNQMKRVGNIWATANEYQRKTIQEKISKKVKAAMQRPEVRERYEAGLKTRKMQQSEETKKKRSDSIKATMAKKYPNRKVRMKFGSPEYRENMAQKSAERWHDPDYRERVGTAISKSLRGKQVRLGQINTPEHNQKLSEANKGIVWWNNGIERKKSRTCPGEGWLRGMTK